MKKILGVLVAIMALAILAVPAMATEEKDLLAGQDIDVGYVEVWNDGDNLYVKYVVEKEGWCMTETHLHVAESEEDIPQTDSRGRGNSGGNPIPGQFEYSMEHDCVTEYTYEISLSDFDVNCSEDLTVAAHAVVEYNGYTDVEETLYLSNGGTDGQDGLFSVDLSGEKANLTQLYSFDESGNFSFVNHIGATPDGSTVYAVSEDTGHLGAYSVSDETFTDLGEIEGYPGEVVQVAVSPEGQLYMTSKNDNLYTVNTSDLSATLVGDTGINVGGADIAFGADGTLYLYSSAITNLYTVDTTTGLATFVGDTGKVLTGLAIRDGGTGQLVGSGTDDNIYVINKTDGSVMDTYPMVMDGESYDHKWGDMTVGELSKPIYQEETAWGDGLDFDGANWATYFTYTVQCVCPSITSSSNVIVLDAPLTDVSPGGDTSETPQVFAEYAGTDHGGFMMDINSTNDVSLSNGGYSVAADTPVCSYYVHFDDGDTGDRDVVTGNISFDGSVMGLIVAGTYTNDIFSPHDIYTMYDVDDILGNNDTIYPSYDPNNGRGLEYPNQDPVSISGNTVDFTMEISNKHDSFRIILPAT